MSICLCYCDEQNFLHERGVCYGTKEKEPCSCGGNPVKCDFYEEVREKYIHRTNYDRLVSKSPEELAVWITELTDCAVYPYTRKDAPCISTGQTCTASWLDWLKQEASDET